MDHEGKFMLRCLSVNQRGEGTGAPFSLPAVLWRFVQVNSLVPALQAGLTACTKLQAALTTEHLPG